MNTKAIFLSWIGLSFLYVLLLMQVQREVASTELAARSAALTSQVSQRADQHDAHLTGLSALAISGQNPNAALFLEVVTAIRQFYPRVTAVDLISLQNDSEVISSREDLFDANALHSAIQAAALRSTDTLELVVSPLNTDRYLIIKRVPNSIEARFALSLEIDTQRLVETDLAFWQKKNSELGLALPDGTQLSQPKDNQQSQFSGLLKPLTVTNVLGSKTQPLALSAVIHLSTADLLPTLPLLLGLFSIGLALVIAMTIFKLYANTRQAERRARLGEHEARIAHASRVNSLGELSSGIAHELTQPLTAILSQSQAGIRLAKDPAVQQDAVVDVLKANVAQAKRASKILARLREWTKHSDDSRQAVDVNECIRNVLFLLDAEIKNMSINLTVQLSIEKPVVTADPVELEQVVFNLVRNALDKKQMEPDTELSIWLTTSLAGDQVVVEVKDDGALVDHKLQDRVFEPFITSRADGMGLGLALCERIVSRMEGNIDIYNTDDGVVARVALPIRVNII